MFARHKSMFARHKIILSWPNPMNLLIFITFSPRGKLARIFRNSTSVYVKLLGKSNTLIHIKCHYSSWPRGLWPNNPFWVICIQKTVIVIIPKPWLWLSWTRHHFNQNYKVNPEILINAISFLVQGA